MTVAPTACRFMAAAFFIFTDFELNPVMASPKRKKPVAFPSGPDMATPKTVPRPIVATDKRPFRWNLILLFLTITIGGTYLAITMRPQSSPPQYTYKLVNTYPHDAKAFTQGLVFDDGFLWESTGRLKESSFRKTDLKTGDVLEKIELDDELFGEGLALFNDKFYQLTWKNNIAFVYNRQLEKINEFTYEGDGWGLTSNETDLIFSNGTSEIRLLDPETFKVRRSMIVRRGGFRAGQLNELEYYNGKIYANVYQTDYIYEIDPNSGDVTAWIDLAGLWPHRERPSDGVLNGIAFNTETNRLLVTGKLCPLIYEIELILK